MKGYTNPVIKQASTTLTLAITKPRGPSALAQASVYIHPMLWLLASPPPRGCYIKRKGESYSSASSLNRRCTRNALTSRVSVLVGFLHKNKFDARAVLVDAWPLRLRCCMTEEEKREAARLLGRLGGRNGGKARAEKLSPERRKEIARKAARVRWDEKRLEEEPS